MKVSDYHIGFVGFGHMAQIIFQAIDHSRLIPRSQISFIRRDPEKMKQNEQQYGITSTSLPNLVEKSHLIILGIRPSQADFVLRDLAQIPSAKSKMVVSVLAGIKLAFFQKYLGANAQILRVMPNLCSAVGEGMSVFTYGSHPSVEFRSLTNLIFSSMGQVIDVSEDLMDISCGIAGSGPGFIFALIEAMAREGERQGLTYAKALKMAAQTFYGAAKLILKGASPERLLTQIATPNGTTEAGLKKLHELHLDKHLQSVVEASSLRSRQISEQIY